MSKNKEMHEALAKPENDREFKLHVLEKLESLDEMENNFKIFKLKSYSLIVLLIAGKEALVRKFL